MVESGRRADADQCGGLAERQAVLPEYSEQVEPNRATHGAAKGQDGINDVAHAFEDNRRIHTLTRVSHGTARSYANYGFCGTLAVCVSDLRLCGRLRGPPALPAASRMADGAS